MNKLTSYRYLQRHFSMCRKLMCIIALLLFSGIKIYAYDFQAGGIYYNIEGDNVAVTSGDSKYEGEIIIPEEVTFNGKNYIVTSIGFGAFYNCSDLTSITIPSSVTSLWYDAFHNCSGLTSIIVESGNTIFDSRNNCNAIISTSTNTLLRGCKNTTIPNSVTSISRDAFYGCSGLTSITIPNSVTSIGNYAFCSCSGMTSITIPSSVTSIGNYAFYDCKGLTSITIPNSVTSIGYYAFRGCSGLTSIIVESDNIKYDSRDNCNAIIETATNSLITGCKNTLIPNTVTTIGEYAFLGCSGLTSITIPNSVTSISRDAFYGCSGLTSITIPNSVTSIGNYAFCSCSGLTSIVSEIVNPFEISEDVFSDYSKPMLMVPSGTKSAYQSTSGWKKFKDIVEASGGNKRTIHVATAGTLPNLISESEKYAIEELTLTGELNGTDFRLLRDMAGCNYLGEETAGKLKVLDFLDAKILAGGEKYYNNNITVNKNDILPQHIFHGCKFISVIISNSVTSIGNYAFRDCRGLTSISIPNSVTNIGDLAFCGCSGLISISIPNSVITIGYGAFQGCSRLASLTIPNSVMSLGNSAFVACTRLTSITIPNSVTSIGEAAFLGCSGLTSITIPNSVTSIGYSAFRECSSLTYIDSEIIRPFEISEDVFDNYSKPKLTVPNGTKSAYQSTAAWNKFTNIVEKEADNIIQGDANGDKEVNVSDIVEVVNFIMDNPSAIFLKTNADLNGDGEVNVTDIVMMVSIIMSGLTGSARTMSNRAGSIIDGDFLSIDDVNINAGETKSVSITLNNPDKKYTAFQFDLTLPEGITIAKNSNGKLMASLDTERKDDHMLSVSELGNNTYRLLAFSMSNAELYGTNGPLVNITLEADANMSSGTNAAALKSQVFTATDGSQYKWSDLPFAVLVNGSENTAIDEISQNGQKSSMIKVYTLTGLLIFSVPQSEFSVKWQTLPSGVYIVNGKKMIQSNNVQNKSIQ